MSKKLNLTGQRFGRLLVIEEVIKENSNGTYWKCKCDCGNETIVKGSTLNSGHTSSCGCKTRETTARRNFKHGESNTRLYNVWKHMLARTERTTDQRYSYYGGRGIRVCEEWHDYIAFSKWAKENGYDETLSIERIDVNGNYCPENCKWATIYEQANNKRYNVFVSYNGKEKSMAEWSRIYGINYQTLMTRYRNGNTGDYLFRPVKN